MHALRLYAHLFLAGAAIAVATAAEHEVKQVFAVQPGCTLKLDTYRGRVAIEESDAAEIRVVAAVDVSAGTEKRAQWLRDGVHLTIAREGENTVAVHGENPREQGIRFVWDTDERVDLFYQISVPRRCNVDLQAGEGSVTIGNLTGRMNARLETGTLSFRRIAGSIEARVDQGDIVISRCSGDVTARVLRGAIRTGTIGGAANLKNSSGDIDVLVALRSLVAVAEAGGVTVGFGPQVSGKSSISVSGGSIVANLHPELACRVDASTTWGQLENKLPPAANIETQSRRHYSASFNGGGASIVLRASGGITLTPDVILLGPEAGR